MPAIHHLKSPLIRQPFLASPIHPPKPALQSFMLQRLVNSHKEGGLTACLEKKLGG